jgi:hypothetical protein
VTRPLDRFADDHPVAGMIVTGDRWFEAWMAQKATPIGRLSKLTGIPPARLFTIDHGGPVSRAELDALARAWSTTTSDLERSIGDPALIVD